MCFQIRSISNESAKLRGVRRLHGWVRKLRGSKILLEKEYACTNLS